MQTDEYEWDDSKAAANRKKHGVTFEEAVTVFDDPRLKLQLDEEHSTSDEERWHAIGFSNRVRLLVTVVVDRATRIRVISARLANAREVLIYAEN